MAPRVLCAVVASFVTPVCAADDAPVEQELQARWTAAYDSGDASALGSMYAADARLRQGYCPSVNGRDAIEAYWRDDLLGGTTKTYLEIEDALALEGALYLSGTYAVEIAATAAVEVRRVGGTYSQIWRHEQGSGWTIHRETWTNLACADTVLRPPGADELGTTEQATAI